MFNIDLSGKIAVITGGGSGLGAVCTKTLAQAGADIAVSDINEDNAKNICEEIQKYNVKTSFGKVDVTNEDEVNDFVDKVFDEYGKIDILVHAAGVVLIAPFNFVSVEQYKKLLDVNVIGTHITNQSVLRYMLPEENGKIVNFASEAGKQASPDMVHYSSTKYAVIGMTQGVGLMCAPYNINVNCVCPGIIKTPMWEKIMDDAASLSGSPREAIWEKGMSLIPMQRPQTEQDIANMVLFLSSELADNITAQAINIDGGMSLY